MALQRCRSKELLRRILKLGFAFSCCLLAFHLRFGFDQGCLSIQWQECDAVLISSFKLAFSAIVQLFVALRLASGIFTHVISTIVSNLVLKGALLRDTPDIQLCRWREPLMSCYWTRAVGTYLIEMRTSNMTQISQLARFRRFLRFLHYLQFRCIQGPQEHHWCASRVFCHRDQFWG